MGTFRTNFTGSAQSNSLTFQTAPGRPRLFTQELTKSSVGVLGGRLEGTKSLTFGGAVRVYGTEGIHVQGTGNHQIEESVRMRIGLGAV